MNFPFQQSDLTHFFQLVDAAKRIVVVAHKSPDGDSIGSTCAMRHFLNSYDPEKEVFVCHPDPSPSFLSWADPDRSLLNFQEHKESVQEAFGSSDLIICMDFNDFSRMGNDMKPLLEEASAKKVMIDHHLNPNLTQFDLSFSFPDRSSTCELFLEIIIAAGLRNLLNPNFSACLYLGIVTDTGSFRYNSVRSETHELVAILLKSGLNHTEVHEETFDDNSLERIRLRSFILSNCLDVWEDLNAAVMYLSETDARRLNMKKGDTEGLVNVALSMRGISRAALFKEEDGYIRISFRSKSNVAVNTIAEQHFQGGGHKQAAGGRFDGDLSSAMAKFKYILEHEVH